MEYLANLLISLINILTETHILGMPLLVWLLIPLLLGLLIQFLKGKKE